ncbi:hypothetical protein WG954_09225 [Lacibacter sp. H375]|uniref:hypothetical protein n=1 Tax=Lacibacter sp. H375 TaxID=3133424 RepID=UPI0030C2CBDC
MKLLLLIFVSAFLIIGCNEQKTSNSKKAFVKQAINAIKSNDTGNVFRLIDTNYCFLIYGKEDFIYKISLASKQIKNAVNEQRSLKEMRSIFDSGNQTTEFIINYYILDSTEHEKNELILKFTLLNNISDNKITFIDFTFKDNIESILLEPIPKS